MTFFFFAASTVLCEQKSFRTSCVTTITGHVLKTRVNTAKINTSYERHHNYYTAVGIHYKRVGRGDQLFTRVRVLLRYGVLYYPLFQPTPIKPESELIVKKNEKQK